MTAQATTSAAAKAISWNTCPSITAIAPKATATMSPALTTVCPAVPMVAASASATWSRLGRRPGERVDGCSRKRLTTNSASSIPTPNADHRRDHRGELVETQRSCRRRRGPQRQTVTAASASTTGTRRRDDRAEHEHEDDEGQRHP